LKVESLKFAATKSKEKLATGKFAFGRPGEEKDNAETQRLAEKH
jgi:hypothetical protein